MPHGKRPASQASCILRCILQSVPRGVFESPGNHAATRLPGRPCVCMRASSTLWWNASRSLGTATTTGRPVGSMAIWISIRPIVFGSRCWHHSRSGRWLARRMSWRHSSPCRPRSVCRPGSAPCQQGALVPPGPATVRPPWNVPMNALPFRLSAPISALMLGFAVCAPLAGCTSPDSTETEAVHARIIRTADTAAGTNGTHGKLRASTGRTMRAPTPERGPAVRKHLMKATSQPPGVPGYQLSRVMRPLSRETCQLPLPTQKAKRTSPAASTARKSAPVVTNAAPSCRTIRMIRTPCAS